MSLLRTPREPIKVHQAGLLQVIVNMGKWHVAATVLQGQHFSECDAGGHLQKLSVVLRLLLSSAGVCDFSVLMNSENCRHRQQYLRVSQGISKSVL
jgi:hypothetical protein